MGVSFRKPVTSSARLATFRSTVQARSSRILAGMHTISASSQETMLISYCEAELAGQRLRAPIVGAILVMFSTMKVTPKLMNDTESTRAALNMSMSRFLQQ